VRGGSGGVPSPKDKNPSPQTSQKDFIWWEGGRCRNGGVKIKHETKKKAEIDEQNSRGQTRNLVWERSEEGIERAGR